MAKAKTSTANGATGSDAKTANRTAVSPLNGATIPLGAHVANTGGKKGRSGRKPLVFAQACNDLVDTLVLPKVRRKLQQMGPDDPAWRWCAEYASKYSKAEVKKPLELSGVDGEPIRFTLDIRTPIRPTEMNGRILPPADE